MPGTAVSRRAGTSRPPRHPPPQRGGRGLPAPRRRSSGPYCPLSTPGRLCPSPPPPPPGADNGGGEQGGGATVCGAAPSGRQRTRAVPKTCQAGPGQPGRANRAGPSRAAQPGPATRRAPATPRSPSPQARILRARGHGEKGDGERGGRGEKKRKQ